jgi:tRNA G18 (ribose-2'-O)-methylase SpoU
MNEPIVIERADDPRVLAFADIRERDRSTRDGIFLGETLVVLEAMLLQPHTIQAVLANRRMLARTQALLVARGCHAPIYTTSDEILQELTGIDLHRGVLATALRAPFEPLELDAYNPPRAPSTVLVLEGITNVDNIGQLYRIAAAFAVDLVVLSPECHDPLYRKSLRVSTGNALKVSSVRTQRWPEDLRTLISRFDLTLITTAIQTSVSLHTLPKPARVAIVVGHESEGVSPAIRAMSHHIARIPMARGVDSLNVAVSAAIALDRLSHGQRE